jgi:hypothetical protein
LNSAQILAGTGIDLPRVSEMIEPVRLDEVEVRPAPRLLRRVWGKGIQAMTVRRTIYVDPLVLGGPHESTGPLILHELIHARQWRRLGSFRFLIRYVFEYLRGRLSGHGHQDAYLGISLEVEARDEASRLA